MSIDQETLKKYFPNLSREIEEKLSLIALSLKSGTSKSTRVPKFRGYEPTVIDFIRRCDNETQALEIVNFLEKRNELSHEEAEIIREILRKKGVRFFGPKKESDWYIKEDPYFSRR
ncbi:MAG: DUF2095 domain-containing protein [Candidatus Methanomethylicia archaeon]|nr:DUF2095 domain-containing protein [Candidatus Methanomethylicia archaeon]MCX8169049.1 DUF2095 domain-containing protein [Candidatus Methanomethylicia archaeon]MDW7988781.1 DUF2095 family protein [Nitrososphaerota archaeon]